MLRNVVNVMNWTHCWNGCKNMLSVVGWALFGKGGGVRANAHRWRNTRCSCSETTNIRQAAGCCWFEDSYIVVLQVSTSISWYRVVEWERMLKDWTRQMSENSICLCWCSTTQKKTWNIRVYRKYMPFLHSSYGTVLNLTSIKNVLNTFRQASSACRKRAGPLNL